MKIIPSSQDEHVLTCSITQTLHIDPPANNPAARHAGDHLNFSEAEVDEASEESFPASDPPSWAPLHV